MALEVYYSQDIRNALLAAEQASSAALVASCEERNDFAQGYEAGYRAALTTLALAFGLIRPEQRRPWGPVLVAQDKCQRTQDRGRADDAFPDLFAVPMPASRRGADVRVVLFAVPQSR